MPKGLKKETTVFQLTEEVKSYVPMSVYAENKEAVDKDFIHRETKDGKVVMHASELLAVLPPASDLDLTTIPLCDTAGDDKETPDHSVAETEAAQYSPADYVPIDDVAVTVHARWLPPDDKYASSAANANVFGRYGTYEVVDSTPALVLPTIDVDKLSDEDLESWGAKKIMPASPPYKNFNTFNEDLFVIVYDYSPDYVEKYTLDKDLGDGWFLETHDFPHFFKPMRPDCGGSCILGKLISEDSETHIGTYKLISVSVKFPESLAIKSEVIHGNAGFTGPYAIPSNPHGKASIVLIHDKEDHIQTIDQPIYSNPHTFFRSALAATATPDPVPCTDRVASVS